MAIPLLDTIYSWTKRPDLVTETTWALKSVLVTLHNLDFFDRDIMETTATIGDPQGNIVSGTLPANFRRLIYARAWPATSENPTIALKIITPGDIYDALQGLRYNSCYAAGNRINAYVLDTTLTRLLIGYNAHPIYSADDDYNNDWILQDYEPAVVHLTAAKMLKRMGSREEANAQTEYAEPVLRDMLALEINRFGVGVS